MLHKRTLTIISLLTYCLVLSFFSSAQDAPVLRIEAPSGESRILSAAISRDGSMIALGGEHTSVWNAMTGEKIALYDKVGYVYSLAFSPDGKKILSGAYNEKTHLWDLNTGETLLTWSTGRPYDPDLHGYQMYEIRTVEFNTDGSRIVIYGGGITHIRLYDAFTGEQLFYTKNGYFVSFLNNPNEILISSPNLSYIYDLEKQKEIRDIYSEGFGRTIDISTDKQYVLNSNRYEHVATLMNLVTEKISLFAISYG